MPYNEKDQMQVAHCGRATDPAALPAVVTAGTPVEERCNLQAIPFVQQADLEAGKDAVSTQPTAKNIAKTVAYAANLVVKNSPGMLLSLKGYNSKGSAQFIQVHNAAALPADTAVPIFIATVAASSNFDFPFPDGLPCDTGIVISNSSTGATKTIGSADVFITALYL